MRPHQPWAGANPGSQRPTLCAYPWWAAVDEPQPHTGNNRYEDAGDHVDPGRSRVDGKPYSPCRHCHPNTEQEADPLLPLRERQQRGERDDAIATPLSQAFQLAAVLGTKPKIHGVRNSQAPKTRLITSASVSLFSSCSIGRPPWRLRRSSPKVPLSSCRSRCARLALRPCRLAQSHWEHAVAERRVHLALLDFFHRNAALEAAILELAEQPISVFRRGRLFAFKERRRSPEERSDRIL